MNRNLYYLGIIKNVRYILALIISFSILTIKLKAQSDSLTIHIDSIASDQTDNYELVHPIETMPEFPGGQVSLRAFIERNNKWQVGKETIVGKVFVGFVIERDGSVTNIELVKTLHKTCDEEAKRIVGIMPKWKPGEIQGQPIRTKMIIPIAFDGITK